MLSVPGKACPLDLFKSTLGPCATCGCAFGWERTEHSTYADKPPTHPFRQADLLEKQSGSILVELLACEGRRTNVLLCPWARRIFFFRLELPGCRIAVVWETTVDWEILWRILNGVLTPIPPALD